MWCDLTDDIAEEFCDLQDMSISIDTSPRLHEEVDEQEWQSHIQLTHPMPECNTPTDPTCECIGVRRWKNQYAEGIYFTSYLGTSWGEQDLKDMANTKFEIDPPAKLVKSDRKGQTIRVQISLKQKGENVKGHYDNIEIPGGNLMEIFQECQRLLELFPKQPRRKINYYTRVQLQHKLGNKMSGGRNLSLHNATPEQVGPVLRRIFKIQEILS